MTFVDCLIFVCGTLGLGSPDGALFWLFCIGLGLTDPPQRNNYLWAADPSPMTSSLIPYVLPDTRGLRSLSWGRLGTRNANLILRRALKEQRNRIELIL